MIKSEKTTKRVAFNFSDEDHGDRLSKHSDLTETIRKRLVGWKYGYIITDDINRMLSYSLNSTDFKIGDVKYYITDGFDFFIIENDFSLIKQKPNVGYHLKYYDKETNELKGFMVIDRKEIIECFNVNKDADDMTLEDFYHKFVENDNDDICFRMMLHQI